MSGLTAVFARDGSPTESAVRPVHEALSYRGHDGDTLWVGDRVALGHQRFDTTGRETDQPVHLDGLHLVLDGRLDDRARFADCLPTTVDLSAVSDAELLAHAYRERGTDAFDDAVGAFAVALCDDTGSEPTFVCARDPTGIRTLFVAVTPTAIVAASDASAVRRHPAVETATHDPAVVAYLTYETPPARTTFDDGIDRLGQGTLLRATPSVVRRRRYWHPADEAVSVDDPATAARRLHERVTTAVTDRLETHDDTTPTLSLSGGLDSTTVAGVASEVGARPHAYSVCYPRRDGDRLRGELERAQETATLNDLPHTVVDGDDHPPLADPTEYDGALAESPCLDPIQPAMDALDRARVDDGHRVKLTGHGGNLFDGSRFAYADLLRRGRLPTLLWRVRADRMTTTRLLLWYGLAPVAPWLVRPFLEDDDPPAWQGPRVRETMLGQPAASERFDSLAHRRDYRSFLGLSRAFKLNQGRRRALRTGVELRMPFLDRRVVALAYQLPPVWLLSDGRPKGLFRRAFRDCLPDSVLSIPRGTVFDPGIDPGLRAAGDHLRETLTDPLVERHGFVANGETTTLCDRFLDEGGRSNQLWRVYATERFLRRRAD